MFNITQVICKSGTCRGTQGMGITIENIAHMLQLKLGIVWPEMLSQKGCFYWFIFILLSKSHHDSFLGNIGSHVYSMLQVFWAILLFCQVVLLLDVNVVLMSHMHTLNDIWFGKSIPKRVSWDRTCTCQVKICPTNVPLFSIKGWGSVTYNVTYVQYF